MTLRTMPEQPENQGVTASPSLGGNPNAVDEMLARAFAALRKARGDA